MTLKEAFLVTFGEMVDAWCFWKRQGLAQFDVFCCLRLMDLQHGNLECEFWNSVWNLRKSYSVPVQARSVYGYCRHMCRWIWLFIAGSVLQAEHTHSTFELFGVDEAAISWREATASHELLAASKTQTVSTSVRVDAWTTFFDACWEVSHEQIPTADWLFFWGHTVLLLTCSHADYS